MGPRSLLHLYIFSVPLPTFILSAEKYGSCLRVELRFGQDRFSGQFLAMRPQHINKLTFLASQHVEPATLQGGQSLQNAITTASEQEPDVAPVRCWPLLQILRPSDMTFISGPANSGGDRHNCSCIVLDYTPLVSLA